MSAEEEAPLIARAPIKLAFNDEHLAAWRRVEVQGISMPVFLRLSFTPDREVVCTGLVIGIEPEGTIVRAKDLRIPLAAIVAELAAELAQARAIYGPKNLPDFIIKKFSPAAGPRARPGARGHPEEHYRGVVARYRQALKDHPSTPTKALIAQYPNYDEATVRYWLRVARKRGLLGRSERGKPGEARRRRQKRKAK